MKRLTQKIKLFGFCGNNTNINFVGAEHNGTNNILLLKNKSSRNIPRIDCNIVIIHNRPQTRFCQPKHKLQLLKFMPFLYISQGNCASKFCYKAAIEYKKKCLQHGKKHFYFLLPIVS